MKNNGKIKKQREMGNMKIVKKNSKLKTLTRMKNITKWKTHKTCGEKRPTTCLELDPFLCCGNSMFGVRKSNPDRSQKTNLKNGTDWVGNQSQ